MIRQPQGPKRTDTLCPSPTLCRSDRQARNARSDDEAGQQIDGDSVHMDGDGARPDCYRPLEDEQQGVATVVDDRQFADQRQGAAPRIAISGWTLLGDLFPGPMSPNAAQRQSRGTLRAAATSVTCAPSHIRRTWP